MKNPKQTVNYMEYGLFIALLMVVLWGLQDAVHRYVMVTQGVNPFVFTVLDLMVGGFCMVLLSGKRRSHMGSFRNLYTWAQGFSRIMATAFFMMALTTLSATESGFLIKANVVFSLIFVWMIMGRKPAKEDFLGIAVVFVGVWGLIMRQDEGFSNPAVLMVLISSVFTVLIAVTAELNPESKKSLGFKDRCRHTGIVLIVSSLVTFVFVILAAFLKGGISSDGVFSGLLVHIPSVDDIFRASTWGWALFLGVVLRAPVTYLYLLSVRLIRSENTLMAMALIPFSALLFESLFGMAGILDISAVDGGDVLLGLMITVGSVLTVLIRTVKTTMLKRNQKR